MVDDQSQSTPPQKPKKKSLWERWRSWSGSFLVMSVLLHVILLGGATLLVVQVVQARKEKLKFTAPPPSANAGAEHKVKPSKKTAAPAPAVSKRITSTAVNASVALPPMEMNSTGPDVMASVMSGLGSAGLGAGMGAGAGMSSMPLQGLTAFGFKGDLKSAGLVGHLYDLKQTKDRKPTEIKDDGLLKDRTQEQDKNYHGQGYDNFKLALTDPKKRNLLADGVVNDAKVINDFFSRSWDPHVLDAYYQSPDPVTAYQFAIPAASPADAVKAFGVENTVKPNHFLVHYQGTIIPPRDGMYRFVATVNNGMFAVRLDGQNVLGVVSPLISSSLFKVTPENPAPYYGPTFSGSPNRGSNIKRVTPFFIPISTVVFHYSHS
jgi:hypothetical protein